jgi:hypothetical protein
MKIKHSLLAASLVSLFAFGAANAETVVVTKGEPTPVVVKEVGQETIVIEQPVTKVPILVREQILVPVGGKISKNDVRLVLEGAGYTDIHDIDWLDHRGVWKAEARDATGDDREIHVDPIDARIVHVEDD